LALAEQITTLIEGGVWTREKFPTVEVIRQRFGPRRDDLKAALAVLTDRKVVAKHADPTIGVHRPRYLPVPGPDAEAAASGPEWLLARIVSRINAGEYTTETFPTIEAMVSEFRCGPTTVLKALKLGQSRGLVQKLQVLRPPPGRGAQWVWRAAPPAAAQGDASSAVDGEQSLADRLAADIEAGSLTGYVESIAKFARRYRVAYVAMRSALEELVARGRVKRVWLPDWSARVWYVLDGKQPDWLPPGDGTRADAIAADLARRIPRWLAQTPAGKRVRHRLPSREKLRKSYRTDWGTVDSALVSLVERGLLERLPPRNGREGDRFVLVPRPEFEAGAGGGPGPGHDT
jgi:DNA-binding GntR family transcriptional regulator